MFVLPSAKKGNRMKITIQKSALMSKLTPAMGTVSNKNTITSIEGVLIETLDSGDIQISTYDMNKGIRAIIPAVSIEEEGKYIVNAQRFYQTVKVLPEDDIVIEVSENLNCTVSSGKASFSMFAMKGADFPTFPELETDKGFEIDAEILRKMISKVQHSVAEGDSRPMLCGAFVKVMRDFVELVSCDSYTLSKCSYKCDVNFQNGIADSNYSFIIPGHALGEICKILAEGEEGKVKINLSRKHAIFKKGDIILFTRTIDSDYIDYNKLVPVDNTIFITVERERLISSLERANLIAEEKIQGSGKSFVKLICEGQYLNLSSSSVNGRVFDEMDCVHEGDNIEIGFNCRYLLNSVRASEGENIKINLKGATQAMTIEPVEKDEKFSFFYMVLPIRMNNEK